MRNSFRSLATATRLVAVAATVAAVAVPAAVASGAPYPPGPTPSLTADPGTVVVNTEFEAVGAGFTAGPVTVVIEGTSISVETEAFAGSLFFPAAGSLGAGFAVDVPAPGTPGPYTVTATDQVGGTASAQIMVVAPTAPTTPPPSGELPKTGSDSTNVIAAGAAGLLAAGALALVASRRRAAA